MSRSIRWQPTASGHSPSGLPWQFYTDIEYPSMTYGDDVTQKQEAATASAPTNLGLPANTGKTSGWGSGGQLQELPSASPFGSAWGGGNGTTYSPIDFNQQASLLSENKAAPNGWMNGLLFNSPYQKYYGG